MYEAFYGFTAKPFKLVPDPGFYFGSKQHARARAYLEYGFSRHEGFIVITGEIGAGKTTVLRSLIDSLDPTQVVVGQLVTTQLDDQDVLRMVAAAFGISVPQPTKAVLLGNIEAFLISQVTVGRRCLLVVDEAQNLSAGAVEELRMLSNFQLGSESLLQSFLVGQPEFRQILAQPDMEQFRQRVAATCHIGPLDAEETQAYIMHRLNAAGHTDRPTFDEAVFAKVHEAAGGIPRRINTLMDRLLLSGFLREVSHLDVAHVQEVAAEVRSESSMGLTGVTAGAAVQGAGRASAGAYARSPSAAVGVHALPVLQDVLINGGPRRRLSAAVAGHLQDELHREQVLGVSERLCRLEDTIQRFERLQERQVQLIGELIDALQDPQAVQASQPEPVQHLPEAAEALGVPGASGVAEPLRDLSTETPALMELEAKRA